MLPNKPKTGCDDKMRHYATWFDGTEWMVDLKLSRGQTWSNEEVKCLLWCLLELGGGKNLIVYTQQWADGIRCILLKAAYTRSAALNRTHLLFGVFGKFRYELFVFQHDQSGCGCTTMPLGLGSLGSLSKMPVWTLSRPGPNVSFSFWFGPNKPREPNYKCEHSLDQTTKERKYLTALDLITFGT